MPDYPISWRYEANVNVRGQRPADNIGQGLLPNNAAARGDVFAKEAAAHGAARLQLPPPYALPPPDPPRGPRGRGGGDDEITGKIGRDFGDAPILPARRKAEFRARQAEQQRQEQMRAHMQHGGGAQAAEPEMPMRSPEEQREYDATVQALRQELASTQIHMATLEQRQERLRRRLADMGESAEVA